MTHCIAIVHSPDDQLWMKFDDTEILISESVWMNTSEETIVIYKKMLLLFLYIFKCKTDLNWNVFPPQFI